MVKTVVMGLLAAACLVSSVVPAAAQTREAHRARRQQARIERQERLRERMQRQALRLDRNRDGWITRAEIARYRAALRREIRRSVR